MEPKAVPQNTPSELGHDMLEGADAIAAFLFGSHDDHRKRKRNRRKIYYLSGSTRLPVFRLGTVLCARKSVLLQFIMGQERRFFSPEGADVPG